MDFILELIFEIIFEGAIEIAESNSKKVPIAVRVIIAIILSVIYVGFCGWLFIGGIKSNNPLVIAIAVMIFLLFSILLIKNVIKVKRRK